MTLRPEKAAGWGDLFAECLLVRHLFYQNHNELCNEGQIMISNFSLFAHWLEQSSFTQFGQIWPGYQFLLCLDAINKES